MSKVLVMRNVKKSYFLGKKRIDVIKRVDFEINEGERVAITGVSGVGKTTLLYLIGGIEKPDEGEIILCGVDITSLDEDEVARIRGEKVAYVFQFFHLLPDFTVIENVMLPVMIRERSYEERIDKASSMLKEVGLGDRLDHLPSELSGGEQQRVGIVRALVMEPKLILADEPTGNLDPHTAEVVFNTLISVVKNKGCALIIATHNPALAERMDKIFKLEGGYLTEAE